MIDLKKIYNKIKSLPIGYVLLFLWSLVWTYRFLYVAYLAFEYGYLTMYFDCEPPCDIDTLNLIIKRGSFYGLAFLTGGVYCLRQVIKFFKKDKK